MQYPKLYYRKRTNTFVGNYIPKQSADIAGFTTNGKTRSMILGKLEEIIRNKQILIRSSRTYEELKTFTWNTGRAEAKRGFHDDLVMSLAIGTWLYDASADYSKSSKGLNDAMLKAMSVKSSQFGSGKMPTKDVLGGHNTFSKKLQTENQNKSNRNNKAGIPNDFLWVIK